MSEPSLERDRVEVLLEEFLQRRRRGESTSVEDYVHRYPELADRIRQIFPIAVWLEEVHGEWMELNPSGLAKEAADSSAEKEENSGLGDSQPAGGFSGPPPSDAPPKCSGTFSLSGNLPFERLGDFRIVREIGRGGMGVVYEAVQESLGRRVAVKVLPSVHLSSPDAVRRFRREAQAAARLHHTNIIPVFGVGQQNGLHYYVMQYIQGFPLDEVLEALSVYLGVQSSCSTVSAKEATESIEACSSQAGGSGEQSPILIEAKPLREGVRQLVGLLLTGGFAGSGGMGGGICAVWESSAHLVAIPGASEGRLRESSFSETAPVDAPQGELTGSASEGRPPKGSGAEAGGTGPSNGDSGASEGLGVRLGRGYWRSVAGIGLQVANALHYAHQQGALHRDIKPGNLILDVEGRVWVGDFGLAKLLDQEEITRSGDVVGTLRYMAPEQWEGRADVRTDVYGLGLTLYEMLVLRPAFDETERGRLIRQLIHEEPIPPRKLQPALPRDLETIVLKAIARQPGDRYQTAGELAEDLRRFLEDRPIRARRVSALERLWRWCRRNKLVAALSAAVVGLLVVVAVVASIGYVRTSAALRRESFQRAQAERARKQADAERRRAELQRQKAQTESARAEANLRLAIQAFEDIFHRIVREPIFQPHLSGQEETETSDESASQELWEVYGWTSALTEKDAAIVQTMLSFYEQFAQQNADNRTLQRETGQAYRRMGEIHLRLGDYPEAEKALLKARMIYLQIASESNDQQAVVLERAMVENRLGNVYWLTARGDQALQSYRLAYQILRDAPPELAPTPACRLELARTYAALGRMLRWRLPGARSIRKPPPSSSWPGAAPSVSEELPDAVTCYREALHLLEQLVEESPQYPEYRLMLARTYRELVIFCGRRLPRQEIASACQKALELVEKLAADFPSNPDYRFELAETYSMLARLRGENPSEAEVSERLQQALRIEMELVRQYPHVPDYQAALARLHTELAWLAGRRSQWSQAEEHLRQALQLQQALVDRFPQIGGYRMELARQTVLLSGILRRQGKKEENYHLLEEAIQKAEKMLPHSERPMLLQAFLSWLYSAEADLLAQMGKTQQAEQARQKAEQLRPKEARWLRIPWLPGSPWSRPWPRAHEPSGPKRPPSSPKPERPKIEPGKLPPSHPQVQLPAETMGRKSRGA